MLILTLTFKNQATLYVHADTSEVMTAYMKRVMGTPVDGWVELPTVKNGLEAVGGFIKNQLVTWEIVEHIEEKQQMVYDAQALLDRHRPGKYNQVKGP